MNLTEPAAAPKPITQPALDPAHAGSRFTETLLSLQSAGDYEAAASWLLERCHGPGIVTPELREILRLSSVELRARDPERFHSPETHPERRLEAAFARQKAAWLASAHPHGYGGVPELAGLRSKLIQSGSVPPDTDFDLLERAVKRDLEAGDLRALLGRLRPRDNRYSCAFFELLSGKKLPTRREDIEALLTNVLGPETVARNQARGAEDLKVRRDLEAQAYLRRLEAELGRIRAGGESLLVFAQRHLEQGYQVAGRQRGAVKKRVLVNPDGTLEYRKLDPRVLEWFDLKKPQVR